MSLNIQVTVSIAAIILVRDSPLHTPISALIALGVHDFPGLQYLANCVHTVCFGVWLASSMECRFALLTLSMIYVHKLAVWLRLSEPILELCDPIYYQPMFDSPHAATTVAEFWGRGWHKFFQRSFIISGGKPMIWFTKKLRMSSKIQKLAGLFGIFASSAVVHEYSE